MSISFYLPSNTHTQRRETHRRQESDVTVVMETARRGCDWLRAADGGRPCLRCTLAFSSLSFSEHIALCRFITASFFQSFCLCNESHRKTSPFSNVHISAQSLRHVSVTHTPQSLVSLHCNVGVSHAEVKRLIVKWTDYRRLHIYNR